MFNDCWSSVGSITFYHRNGKCYWRRKPAPVFPGTPAQMQQASVHHRAIMAWQQLTSAEQHKWRDYARAVPAHRPPFLKENHISGYNLFVSAYHGFAQLGNEHVPVPQPYPQFPSMSLEIVGSRVVNSTDLELSGKLLLSDRVTPERWQLLTRLQLTAPGGGYDAGKLRSFMAIIINVSTQSCCSSSEATILVPNYKKVWGINLTDYTLHYRAWLLDSMTGYRSNDIRGKIQNLSPSVLQK